MSSRITCEDFDFEPTLCERIKVRKRRAAQNCEKNLTNAVSNYNQNSNDMGFDQEEIPPGWLSSINMTSDDVSGKTTQVSRGQFLENTKVKNRGKTCGKQSSRLSDQNKKRISRLKQFDSKILGDICYAEGIYTTDHQIDSLQPMAICNNVKSMAMPAKSSKTSQCLSTDKSSKKTRLMNKIISETTSFRKNIRAHSQKKAHVIAYVPSSPDSQSSFESSLMSDRTESDISESHKNLPSLKLRIKCIPKTKRKTSSKINVKIPMEKLPATVTSRLNRAQSSSSRKSQRYPSRRNKVVPDSEDDSADTVLSKKYDITPKPAPNVPVVRLQDICKITNNEKFDLNEVGLKTPISLLYEKLNQTKDFKDEVKMEKLTSPKQCDKDKQIPKNMDFESVPSTNASNINLRLDSTDLEGKNSEITREEIPDLPSVQITTEPVDENDNDIIIEKEVDRSSRCKTPELVCISDDEDDMTEVIKNLVLSFEQFQAGLLDPAEFTLKIKNFKSQYPGKDFKQLMDEYKKFSSVGTVTSSQHCTSEQTPVSIKTNVCISCGRLAISFCKTCNVRCCYTAQCTDAHLKTCRRTFY